MFRLKYSKHFKKDLKLFKHDNSFLLVLEDVLDTLASGKPLAKRYNNHPLKGEFKGCFECHLRPNVLLIYKIDKQEVSVLLLRIASHSNLF